MVVEGAVEVGEQYAMHMENQICVALPQEGFYVVYASTQYITKVKNTIASNLDIGANLYVCPLHRSQLVELVGFETHGVCLSCQD